MLTTETLRRGARRGKEIIYLLSRCLCVSAVSPFFQAAESGSAWPTARSKRPRRAASWANGWPRAHVVGTTSRLQTRTISCRGTHAAASLTVRPPAAKRWMAKPANVLRLLIARASNPRENERYHAGDLREPGLARLSATSRVLINRIL